MIGIYKIENIINHKIYIGQSIDIKYRWKVHRQPSTYLDPTKDTYYYKIYTAFRKYGIDNFDFSVIEECDIDQLNEREIYWIEFYNSYYNGYNMTLGGEGINRPSDKKVYQYDRLGNFIQEFDNVRTAADNIGVNSGSIYCALCDHHLSGGYQWSYEKNNRMPFYENDEDPVIAYDLNGNKIRVYNSIQEAARLTSDGWGPITYACKNQKYIKTKFQWRYAKDFYNVEKLLPCQMYKPTAVKQYTLDGEFVRSYNDFSEIIKELNITSTSNLSSCLAKKQKSCYGFLWTYYNEPAPKPYVDERMGHFTSSSKRKIKQFTKQNVFLAEYPSAHEAARQIDKPKCANHITECCQGKRKTCEGYIWKYSEE